MSPTAITPIKSASLTEQAGLPQALEKESRLASDAAWIEVIQRMDEVYADLIHSQVKLEDSNDALQKAYSELQHTIEELKDAQQQLIQAEKMASLGRLVAGVAHELNNPISFVFANMHALQGYHRKFRQYIDAIHQNIDADQRDALREKLRIDRMMNDIVPLIEGSMEGAERVSDIVKNLSQYATPQKQSTKAIDLIPVIQRAIKWVLKATSLKIKVHQQLPTELNLTNNEGYIHQILINLFQNAIDAIGHIDKPELFIELTESDRYFELSIRDNGEGIAEEQLNTIFDPFFTTKPVGSGTGLGLSISIGLANEQCQGGLKVRNHPKGGADFVLSLPKTYKS